MSEHWKSTPKYWCKHCSIYVKDTPLERKQHESTGKHQGNLKRFLNGIQKDHARVEREKDRAKAEVDRLNRIAGIGSSSVLSTSSSPASVRSTNPSSKSISADDQRRQWAQLAEMGIPIPEHARLNIATPGDWQTMSRTIVDESQETVDDKLNIGVRKRKFDGQEEEQEAGDTVARRGWGAATKTYPGFVATSGDLDTLLAAPVFKTNKKKATSQNPDAGESGANSDTVSKSILPGQRDSLNPENVNLKSEEIKTEEDNDPQLRSQPSNEDTKLPESSEQQETSIPLFKKRRPKYSQAQSTD